MNEQPLQWTPEQIAAFWEFEARFPERFFMEHAGKHVLREFSGFIARDKLVVDYACGTGKLLAHLLKRGYTALGVEPSQAARAAVQERFGDDPNFRGVFSPDDPALARMDIGTAFACEVLEHLTDEWLVETATRLRALLAAEGRLLITTPNDETLQLDHIRCPNCAQVFHRWQHVRSWTTSSLKAWLERSGFDVERIYATDFEQRYSSEERAIRLWRGLMAAKKLRPRQTIALLRGRPDRARNLIAIARART